MPMLPEAPGLFSTTTDWPHFRESFSPTMSGSRSATPPAGNGTTMYTGCVGYGSSAEATSGTARKSAASAARCSSFMKVSGCREGRSIDHGKVEPFPPGASDGRFVARIRMAHDSARRVVAQHPSQAHARRGRAVADDHHARVLRVAYADAAAVVDRDPGSAARRAEQRVEERPVGHRVAAVAHRLGLAVRARDGARIEVVAADHDGRLELAARDHVVEGLPDARAIAHADPADARGKPLEADAAARHVEPVVEMRVVGDELLHLRVGLVDVLRVAGERDPAERAVALAEERAHVRRHEAREVERVRDALVLRHLADVVAVVDHGGAALLE